jgi:hypothetical protein
MRLCIIIALLLIPFISNAQADSLHNENYSNRRDTVVNKLVISNPIQLADQTQFNVWDHMPWITALFIGLVTLVLGHRQLTSNEKILKEQIKSAQEIAKLDFNKVVISGNRQEWINELRNILSAYMSKVEVYQSMSAHVANADVLREKLENILALEMKIALMLNPSENDSIELTKFLHLYTQAISGQAITQPVDFLKSKIVEISQRLLKIEWVRVKKGE